MKTFVFIFNDGPKIRNFQTTFDAFGIITDAYNMYEEYFVGARYDSEEGNFVNMLHAEEYLRSVAPVKEYLEHACMAGFDDSQIIDDVRTLYNIKVTSIPSNWKQHMKEYSEGYKEYLEKAANAECPGDNK